MPEPNEVFSLPARPHPLSLNVAETAVIVIDMQNAYASLGGYVDLAGFDISGAAAVIGRIGDALKVARAAGVQVIYLQNGWDSSYVEAGTPGSPNWHKSNALKTMRRRPELQGKLLARGGWDYDIIDALTPQPGDIRVARRATVRVLQFATRQHSFVRAASRNLVFVGIATNVCVESTLRDGFHLEYFRRNARGCDPSTGAGLYPEGLCLQRRDLLRLGLHGRRFQVISQPTPRQNERYTVILWNLSTPRVSPNPIAPYSAARKPTAWSTRRVSWLSTQTDRSPMSAMRPDRDTPCP